MAREREIKVGRSRTLVKVARERLFFGASGTIKSAVRGCFGRYKKETVDANCWATGVDRPVLSIQHGGRWRLDGGKEAPQERAKAAPSGKLGADRFYIGGQIKISTRLSTSLATEKQMRES